MEVKEGRIPSHLFSKSRKKCQNTYSMTFHMGYQSMHSTEHHLCLPTQDSGMICFILWAMYVEITSNLCHVEGLEGLNTEICEQVNSYLQCIKYTGAHLSQECVMFFTQFFLYLLNQKKTKKLRKNTNVALAFQL